MDKQDKIAVLVDAENISQKYIKLVLDEVSDYGVATYKRIYGDFSNPGVMSWQDKLREFALTPIFQFNYTKGKNASDSALIIDAMDILYSGDIDGFCLVTSDSDFTKLAVRLREAGMKVIGMGEQKTPNSFVAACETFKFLDLLYRESLEDKQGGKDNSKNVPTEPVSKKASMVQEDTTFKAEAQKKESPVNNIPSRQEIKIEIISIIQSRSDENGWVNLSEIGIALSKRVPGFDPRNYKCLKLREFIESYDGFEVNVEPNYNNKFLKVVYVKIKETN